MRIIREQQVVGKVNGGVGPFEATREYEGRSRLVAATFPNGRRVTRSYDENDRLTGVVEAANQEMIMSTNYVGFGRLLRRG